jgi:hypothetical protein
VIEGVLASLSMLEQPKLSLPQYGPSRADVHWFSQQGL